ncbi:MAG: hypothetical protein ACLUVC_12220 [Longibaculum sp.]
MPIDIQAGLYHYGLGLIKRENHLYSLVDLQTGEWYEKMTIYYIEILLNKWNHNRILNKS